MGWLQKECPSYDPVLFIVSRRSRPLVPPHPLTPLPLTLPLPPPRRAASTAALDCNHRRINCFQHRTWPPPTAASIAFTAASTARFRRHHVRCRHRRTAATCDATSAAWPPPPSAGTRLRRRLRPQAVVPRGCRGAQDVHTGLGPPGQDTMLAEGSADTADMLKKVRLSVPQR